MNDFDRLAGASSQPVASRVWLALATLFCLALLSACFFAWAQPAPGAYDPLKPDLRGRWAGIIVGTAGGWSEPSDGGIENIRFEAEISGGAASGWTMTLTRAPYDPGAAEKPVSVTFPIGYSADGRINFTAAFPNKNGKMIALQFSGQPNPRQSGRHMIGRGFSGTFTGPGSAYAHRMIAGRVTDAPGIAPIIKGVPAAELARWPVTLANHFSEGRDCGYTSFSTPPALVGVHGSAAVYAIAERRFTTSVCILHDIPGSQPIFTLDTPVYGAASLSQADTDRLNAILQSAWNSEWGGGASVASNLSIQHFVRNRHLFGLYNEQPEEGLLRTEGGKATSLIQHEDMLATGKPMNSADAFIAARAMEGDRKASLASKQAREKPDLDAAFAERDAHIAARAQVAAATRPALAKRHGYINHDDAYWAGIAYQPKDGERPGADLRLVFDGKSGAEAGSPLANVYLADYVKVVGDRCGVEQNWPVIPITTIRTMRTVSGFGRIVSQSTNATTINYYVDPVLYDEFSAAIDPSTAGRYRGLRAVQLVLSMLRGEPNAIDFTVQAHARALKELAWMVAKEGCDSPSMRQLAINLKLMSLNKPSLQAAATGSEGSRSGSDIYGENGFTFIGKRRIATETMALAPIVAGGKTYTWQEIVKIGAGKIAANQTAGRAWWHPVLFRDDAGNTYLLMNNRDPESEGDEVIRTYLLKISKADIAAWRSIRAKYDMTKQADIIRAETELLKLRVVRLMTYTLGGVRVTGDQDYPAWFEAARTGSAGERRPQTIAEWIADPLH